MTLEAWVQALSTSRGQGPSHTFPSWPARPTALPALPPVTIYVLPSKSGMLVWFL